MKNFTQRKKMTRWIKRFSPSFIFSILLLFSAGSFAIDLPYQKNELLFGYYNQSFDVDFPRPPSPIFWKAMTKMKEGFQFNYQRKLYDNHGRFAFYLGGVLSIYQDVRNKTLFVESIYPELRYWFIRSPEADFFFAYSVAGFSILSQRTMAQSIDGTIVDKDLGGYFSFQDYIGLGAVLGKSRSMILSVRLVHYSNGDLLPKNPGFDVPIMLYLGYSF